jgi:hypothetical protein
VVGGGLRGSAGILSLSLIQVQNEFSSLEILPDKKRERKF